MRHCEAVRPKQSQGLKNLLPYPETASGASRPRRDGREVWIGILSLLLTSQVLFSGCAVFLLGAGAAGGYAISKDTIQGHFDKSFDRVWEVVRKVLMKDGFIRSEDKVHGRLEAEVAKSQVNIDVKQLTPQTIQLQVKARKGYKLLPDADLANHLYNQIATQLK